MAPGDMLVNKTVEGTDHTLIKQLEERVKALEAQIAEISERNYLELPTNPATYTVTNEAVDRTYNANSTTTDELADVLGTLINDLSSLGVIDT